MPTKAELLKQAKKAGVDVPSSATKADIEAALADGEAKPVKRPERTTADRANGNFTDGPIAPPHEVNSSLASDRMRALNEDHIAMGARPETTESDASKAKSAEPPREEGPIHFRDSRP
jgi:hypothetical protein